jgi:hypothetical protein
MPVAPWRLPEHVEGVTNATSTTHERVLSRRGLHTSNSASSWADPMCSMSRDPRREECTICTAMAPGPVFTMRTYGDTGIPYGPGHSAQIRPARRANPQVIPEGAGLVKGCSEGLWRGLGVLRSGVGQDRAGSRPWVLGSTPVWPEGGMGGGRGLFGWSAW